MIPPPMKDPRYPLGPESRDELAHLRYENQRLREEKMVKEIEEKHQAEKATWQEDRLSLVRASNAWQLNYEIEKKQKELALEKNERLEGQIATQREEKQQLMRQLDSARDNGRRLRRERDEARRTRITRMEVDQRVEQLTRQVRTLEAEQQELAAEVVNATEYSYTLEGEIENRKRRIRRLRDERNEGNLMIEQLEEERGKKQRRIEELEEEIEELGRDQQEKQQKINEFEVNQVINQAQLNLLEAEKRVALEEKAEIQTQYEALEMDLHTCNEHLDFVIDENEEFRQIMGTLKNAYHWLMIRYDGWKLAYELKRDQVETLMGQLGEGVVQLMKIKAEGESVHAKMVPRGNEGQRVVNFIERVIQHHERVIGFY